MNRRWLYFAIAVVVVAIAGVLGVRSYQAFSDLEGRYGSFSRLHVWFAGPSPGSQLPVGSFTPIQAKAEGPVGIVALELWEGDQVIDVLQVSDGTSENPFWANFSWLPETLGIHYLTARVVDEDGNSSTSALLTLDIVPEESLSVEQINMAYSAPGIPAHSVGAEVPASDGGGVPYSAPSPPQTEADKNGEDQGAQQWSPSIIKWLGSFFPLANKPAAPGIVAAVESCRPRLFISDHSDNEDGFLVYRLDPGNASFLQVASLAAYPGPTFTFKDEDLYGTYQYYVAAFNGAGQAESNIVTVEVLSENCRPEPDSGLTIKLADLLSASNFDMGYCYYSLDGMHWQRHPQGNQDFFYPMSNGQDDADMVIGNILDHAGPTPFDLDCWGWGDGDLSRLGAWHWDDLNDGAFEPTEAGTDFSGEFQPVDVGKDLAVGQVGPTLFKLRWDYAIPTLVAWVAHGPQECADFSNIPNPIILGLICGDIAEELDMIVWAVQDGCPAQGFDPNATCYTPDDIDYFNVYDTMHDGGETPIQTVKAPATLYFLFDPTSCAPRTIFVSAVVKVDGQPHESFFSNQVYYPGNPLCPVLLGTEPQNFRITWDTIDFSVGNIDDGVDAEDDAEAYGYMGAWNYGTVPLSWTLQFYPEFEDDEDDNPYNFASIFLCKGFGPKTYCSISEDFALLLVNNNTADFSLFLGEHADWHVSWFDKDTDSADEVLCSLDPYVDDMQFFADHVFFPGETQTFTRTKHHNSASCRVTFHIEALP